MTALERAWYRPCSWSLLLIPLAWLFSSVVAKRRQWLEGRQESLSTPVVIVGNITVGGTGKTPLLIALVQELQKRGFKPGVISRGYGGKADTYPMPVYPDTDAASCGDEPLLIALSCNCPVVVDPDRLRAARLLENQCDIILSDDGLQHYRLPRDLEIIVVDGERMLGNRWCLPAGPLREPPARLYEAAFTVINGSDGLLDHPQQFRMNLQPLCFRPLGGGEPRAVNEPPGEGSVHAVAGIGNPTRFARTLASLGLAVKLHPFADHHDFNPKDLCFDDQRPVIITAKDGVKCQGFDVDNVWVLDVKANLENNGMNFMLTAIESLVKKP